MEESLLLLKESHIFSTLPRSLPGQRHISLAWRYHLPICSGALAYLLCILATAEPLYDMLGFAFRSWISNAILTTSNLLHLPENLHFAADIYVSQQQTAYLEFFLLMLLAFAIYGLCAYAIRLQDIHQYGFISGVIWLTAIASGCIYLFTPVVLSDDVFGYASYGRLLSVHHVNPYFVPPFAYPHDPSYPLIHWKHAFAPYGPVWIAICAVMGLLAGPDRFTYLVAFRLVTFAAHLLNILLVAAILRTLGRSPRIVAVGTLLYAWNPLVVLESTLGGHNDVFVLTLLLLGLLVGAYLERKGRRELRYAIVPTAIFTLAALVKLSAAPLVAFPVLKLGWDAYHVSAASATSGKLPALRRWRSAVGTALLASVASMCIALVGYAPFWIGHSLKEIAYSFSSQPTENFAFNSILAALTTWQHAHSLPAYLALFTDRHVWNVITAIVILLSVIFGAWWLRILPTTRTVALTALVSLAALLLVTPWFTSWYVVPLAGLAAACLPVTQDRLARALFAFALAFSASVLLTYYYVSIGHLLLVFQPTRIAWFLLVCCATFGVPLLVFCLFLLFSQPEQCYTNAPSSRSRWSGRYR